MLSSELIQILVSRWDFIGFLILQLVKSHYSNDSEGKLWINSIINV